jgi:antitoxin YefM
MTFMAKMVIIMTIINHVSIRGGVSMQAIEAYVPITQAKAKLLDMVRQIDDTNDAIAITKNGIPEAVLLSMKKFDGLLETIDVLADQVMMEQLRESFKDVKAGRLIDLDEAL